MREIFSKQYFLNLALNNFLSNGYEVGLTEDYGYVLSPEEEKLVEDAEMRFRNICNDLEQTLSVVGRAPSLTLMEGRDEEKRAAYTKFLVEHTKLSGLEAIDLIIDLIVRYDGAEGLSNVLTEIEHEVLSKTAKKEERRDFLELLIRVFDRLQSFEDIAFIAAGPLENLWKYSSEELFKEFDIAIGQHQGMKIAITGIWCHSDPIVFERLLKLLHKHSLRYDSLGE